MCMSHRQRRKKPLLSYYENVPVDPSVSRVMSKNRGKDTGLELRFRVALSRTGVRYRCHPRDVPGRPDVVHKGTRVVVFVDGCFWHGCPKHFRLPKTRTAFWREKIQRNKASRARVLKALGGRWKTFEFYECDIEENTQGCAAKVSQVIRTRKALLVTRKQGVRPKAGWALPGNQPQS